MTSARLIALLVVAGALGGVLGAAPAGALSPEAAAAQLAQRFDVKVLRVTPIERDGKRFYAVVVMNPGGNFNEAFRATTLIVDPESGDLVPQFGEQNSADDLPAASTRRLPADDDGAAIRRETFRGR